MNWPCVFVLFLIVFGHCPGHCDGCRLKFSNKDPKKTAALGDSCREEKYTIKVCFNAINSRRFYDNSVVRSDAEVLSLDFVENRTLVQLNISNEYSQFTRGYLLIFDMDDGSTQCWSAVFPRWTTPSVVSFTMAINGRCSDDPEIHQLLDIPVKPEVWMSDLIINNSNSSYLKITFDVKNRNVKWYDVELWDIENNPIKTERTEKNFVIFRNITQGMYYTMVSISEMMKGRQCPCGIEVRGHRLCETCLAKKSGPFQYPMRSNTAVVKKKSSQELNIAVYAALGGCVAVAGILAAIVIMKKYSKRLIKWMRRDSFGQAALMIISTNSQSSDKVKMLTNTIKAKLNIVCQHLNMSLHSISQFPHGVSSDALIVVVSDLILEHQSILLEKFPNSLEDESLIFVVIDNADYDITSLMRYPMFDITNGCDRLLEFLSLKLASRTKTHFPQGDIHAAKTESISMRRALNQESEHQAENVTKILQKMDDLKYAHNALCDKYESVSEIAESQTKLEPEVPSATYFTGKNNEAEMSAIFSCRSWFLPPDDRSEADSAYKTQSECMKNINDIYDASRQRGENVFISSAEIEAISLGERSV